MKNDDPIFNAFLRRQLEEGLALAAESDVLHLLPLPGDPPSRYIATFCGEWLAQDARGQIVTVPLAVFGIQFPPDYLRTVEPPMIVSVLEPLNLFHPNIISQFVCLGAMPPGNPLCELLLQIFEVICFHRYSPHSPLNEAAAQWARHQPAGRFPIDRRPLRRPAPRKEVAA